MSARPAVGDEMPPRQLEVGRADVIRYCGASGDFNPLHWSDRAAREAGLPGVIAHGMLTMGVAARALLDWCGDPAAVVSYTARFARPFPIPDAERAPRVTVGAAVTAVEGDLLSAEVSVTGEDGGALLSRARVELRWPG